MPELLARAVADIAAEAPDLLVIGGDLLDYPSHAPADGDLPAAAERDLRLIDEVLGRLECARVVVHGNHDPADRVFGVFGHLPRDRVCSGHRVICFSDDEVDNNVPQRMGPQREKFLEVTGAGDGPPQIHVQHYVVWPEMREGYPHSYREAAHLRERIVGCGRVRLVLSGHYHRGLAPFRDGKTHFATAPAFCEPPHPYWLYELTGEQLRWERRQVGTGDGPARKVVFLDRDGTINPQRSYRGGPGPFTLIPGARRALATLRQHGFALVVVSNQSAVGEGFVTPGDVGAVNDKMARLLAEPDSAGQVGVELDGVYCSYYSARGVLPEYRRDHPDTKPGPGMLLRAADDLRLDLGRSFIIGDSLSDLRAGRAVGAQTVLVATGGGREAAEGIEPGLADVIVDDLGKAADWILAHDDEGENSKSEYRNRASASGGPRPNPKFEYPLI